MTTPALALVVVLGAAAIGRPAHAARGRVTYATDHWAFLDRGLADGLRAGHRVALLRHGHRVGRCRVIHVSEHHAACATRGARSGDLAVYRSHPVRRPRVAKGAPPVPVPRALALRFARLRIARVPFRGAFGSGSLVGMRLKAAFEHQSWVGLATRATRYHRESIEVSLEGVPLWAGFTANADATVVDWPDRPTNTRYRPDAPVQLFVWQTAVTRRMAGGLTLSAGRFQPWHTPGVTLLDGVQLGWEPASGTSEIGVYAGALPNIVTLAPSTSQWTTGLYVAQRFRFGRDVRLRYEGRAGFTRYNADPGRLEAEAVASAELGPAISTDLDLRVALAGHTAPAPAVDAFRYSVDVRPSSSLSFDASYRYLSPFAADADALFTWHVPGSRHLDASASWSLSPSVTLGLDGDGAWILDSVSTTRGDLGPELSFPRFFGDRGSVAFGVREGFGWTGGPVVWAQALYSPGPGFHLMIRGDYMSTTYVGRVGDRLQEGGVFGSASFDITRSFSAHLALMGRTGFGTAAITGSAGVTGRF